ncbi:MULTISPECIES: hypothetical protein [Robinsoniella]|uniref:hypothetical protein n=1 Tax=Robinsoniella TaxID=588605 RepID=UPI0012DEEC60|nr:MULTISPECIES: hypothetical protein [Robinsoniella]
MIFMTVNYTEQVIEANSDSGKETRMRITHIESDEFENLVAKLQKIMLTDQL